LVPTLSQLAKNPKLLRNCSWIQSHDQSKAAPANTSVLDQYSHPRDEGFEMNMLWGFLMAAVGVFMLICGTTKSEFIVYRLLVARSRLLWGDAVHRFYQFSGLVVAILGILWAMGITWRA